MRRSFILIASLCVLVVLYAGYELWQNNRLVEPPSQKLIPQSLENGIHWLVANREIYLSQDNAMLWWFVKESAEITRDERLYVLFSEYKKHYLDPHPENVWWHLFDA